MLADSHAHILDPRLAERADEIAANLATDGLAFMVEISASPTESREALAFASRHENVYCTIGVHPHNAADYTPEFEHWAIAAVTDASKIPLLYGGVPAAGRRGGGIVAVGECGLDYYRLQNSKELQQDVFTRQILLADKLGLPLVVHTREALTDTLAILIAHKKHVNNGILFHCFSEDETAVTQIREHYDAYFAFGGAVTYKNNRIAAAALAAVPLNRLLVETDCPYLSPEPLRGKINEPKNVHIVAAHIAKVLNLTKDEIAAQTLANTKRFYRIK